MLRGVLITLLGALLVFQAASFLDIFERFGGQRTHEDVPDMRHILRALASSYIPPILRQAGVTKAAVDEAAHTAQNNNVGRGATMVVQVIKGKIWVGRSKFTSPYAWDKLRAQHILEILRLTLKETPLPDFEFVLNLHDCPLRSLTEYIGPVFSITKCVDVPSIPLPQWFVWRDGAFGNWNKLMDDYYDIATAVPWAEKEDKAAFWGALRPTSLKFDGQYGWIDITAANWNTFGRGKVWELARDHPDLFDVGLMKAESVPKLKYILKAMKWVYRPYLNMKEQSKTYRYVIYLEGTCGWADRLKSQLAMGMVIFMQTTPCHEYFYPLLKPMVHYIPIKNDLSDLVFKIRWAKTHQEQVKEIGHNAADFARIWLSQQAWMMYVEEVFKTYASLMRYQPKKRKGVKRFKGATPCENTGESRCDDSASYI